MAGNIIFNRVAIAGVGLIGGSLALAGKRAGIFGSVVGLGRGKANLDDALRLGIIDEATSDLKTAAAGADLFFAAVPVESIAGLVLQAAAHLPQGAVITDGGSVKGKIVERLDAALPPSLFFVGGHPVAGTEKTGAAAAFADLYKGRYTILTPTEKTNPAALDKVKRMWEAAGSRVEIMAPEDHDGAMSAISHLPHLVAFALMEAVMQDDPDGTKRRFAAGGLRDTTRIAASDPAMWRDIFSMNRKKLLSSLALFQDSLDRFLVEIESGDFEEVRRRIEAISAARRARDGHG